MPVPVFSRIGMPALFSWARIVALPEWAAFASVSIRTRTGTPAFHLLMIALLYAVSVMNQKATSMATRSFWMSVTNGARQSSYAGSQSFSSAAARDGHKLMMKATAIAVRIAFPRIRISHVSHSANTAEPGGALGTFAKMGADRWEKLFLRCGIPPHARTVCRKRPVMDGSGGSERHRQLARQCFRGARPVDDAVDGWTPRTLSGARRAASKHHVNQRAGNPRCEGVALRRREPAPVNLLQLRQRAPEGNEISVSCRGQQRHQDEMSDVLDFVLRRLGQRRERVRLGRSTESGLPGWDRQHAVPLRRELDPRDQRTASIAAATTAAFDHQATRGKHPRADCRAPRPAHGEREGDGIQRDRIDLRQRATDRQRQLRSRSEPGVGRQCLFDRDVCAG